MELWEIMFLAAGVSMDAFAAAICKGMSARDAENKHSLLTGIFFGGFQAFMPLAGYYLGKSFSGYITTFDHWISFALLFIIGAKMIRESRDSKDDESHCDEVFSLKSLTILAIATSIDALAVGVTFAFLDVSIIPSVTIIGVTTFLFSYFGVRIGTALGSRMQKLAELFGGAILIFIGLRILLTHLNIVSF